MVVLFNSLVSKSVPVHIPLSLQGGDCDHKYLINGRTWFLLLVRRYFVYLTGISTCYSVYSSRSAKKLDQNKSVIRLSTFLFDAQAF